MNCICGNQTVWKLETYKKILYFPVECCDYCGEKFYHAKDLKKADKAIEKSVSNIGNAFFVCLSECV